jgi:chromosome partitioning protein
MRVVSVINYKGGVGKTTLTANLGAELAWRGKQVLLVDLDPQASLTFSFIRPEDWQKNFAEAMTIKSWYDAALKGEKASLGSLVHSPRRVTDVLRGRGKLDLVSSHLGLINVDLELATQLFGATLAQGKRNFLKVHRRLAEGLAEAMFQAYDVVLIDCPPNFNIVTKTAIVASDSMLIPARPDYLSTLGIDYLIRSLRALVGDYNDYVQIEPGNGERTIDPEILGVVFTMIQEYGGGPIQAQRPYIAQTAKLPDIKVFKNYVKRNDTAFADAPLYGVPVVLLHYTSSSHQGVVSGLEGFVNEFIAALGL